MTNRCIGTDRWRHLAGPRCDTRPVRHDLLDEVVWTEVLKLIEEPEEPAFACSRSTREVL